MTVRGVLSINDLMSKPYTYDLTAGENKTTGKAILLYGAFISESAGGAAATLTIYNAATAAGTDLILLAISTAEATAGHTAQLRWVKGIPLDFLTFATTGTPTSAGVFYRIR